MFVCLQKDAKQCCDATKFDCTHCAGQHCLASLWRQLIIHISQDLGKLATEICKESPLLKFFGAFFESSFEAFWPGQWPLILIWNHPINFGLKERKQWEPDSSALAVQLAQDSVVCQGMVVEEQAR